jgi:hypothetical protein
MRKTLLHNFLKLCSLLLVLLIALSISSCSLISKIAGADIDPEQFEKYRQSKALSIRAAEAEKLSSRLSSGQSFESGDIHFYLGEEFLKRLLSQYQGRSGLIRKGDTFTVKSVDLKLYNGCAIATMMINARMDTYNVAFDVSLDCLVSMKQEENEIRAVMEPFNIAPSVFSNRIIFSNDELISNLIKLNMAQIGKMFPPIKIPIKFDNQIEIDSHSIKSTEKVNIQLDSPGYKIGLDLGLKEILIFEKKVLVSLVLLEEAGK